MTPALSRPKLTAAARVAMPVVVVGLAIVVGTSGVLKASDLSFRSRP